LFEKTNSYYIIKKTILLIAGLAAAFVFGLSFRTIHDRNTDQNIAQPAPLKLGAFSVSLNVKDLKASKQFYEALGFTSFGGDVAQNYLIMKNGNALVGIFQGFFEGNILTFNPGWDENAKNFDPFDDVRVIQNQLKSQQITLINEADETTTGPAYIMLKDPDGNMILVDQHR